jgi:hypothetical protein
MIDLNKIQNSHLLTDVFGKFPSFHDAEVHRLNLVRGETRSFNPTLFALIHVFQMTSEVDEKNHYVLKNHVLVEFRFLKVSDLEIVGFNHQNVLQFLEITETLEAEEEAEFDVLFEGIFGVSAKFHCETISIESVTPYERKTA